MGEESNLLGTPEIQDRVFKMYVCMDKLSKLNSLYETCDDDDLAGQYYSRLELELIAFEDLRQELKSLLTAYFKREESENLPVNLSYRMLMRSLEL